MFISHYYAQQGSLQSFTFDLGTGRLQKGHRVTLNAGFPITNIQSRSWISREARDPSVLVNIADDTLRLFRFTVITCVYNIGFKHGLDSNWIQTSLYLNTSNI